MTGRSLCPVNARSSRRRIREPVDSARRQALDPFSRFRHLVTTPWVSASILCVEMRDLSRSRFGLHSNPFKTARRAKMEITCPVCFANRENLRRIAISLMSSSAAYENSMPRMVFPGTPSFCLRLFSKAIPIVAMQRHRRINRSIEVALSPKIPRDLSRQRTNPLSPSWLWHSCAQPDPRLPRGREMMAGRCQEDETILKPVDTCWPGTGVVAEALGKSVSNHRSMTSSSPCTNLWRNITPARLVHITCFVHRVCLYSSSPCDKIATSDPSAMQAAESVGVSVHLWLALER